MNTAFNIESTNGVNGTAQLVIQAGRQGIALLCFNKENNSFGWLKVFHFEKNKTDADIASDVKEILYTISSAHNFDKVNIIWTFDQFLLVPQQYYSTDTSVDMLELVFGNYTEGTTQNDFVYKQNLHTIYKIPAVIKLAVTNAFPQGIQYHQASLLTEMIQEDALYVIFYPGSLVVAFKKDGQLKAVKDFNYNTPEDAAYYLLSICAGFDADPAETIVTAAGMLDADSNLFAELHKYFKGILFEQTPEQFVSDTLLKDHPSHYFSNILASAACV